MHESIINQLKAAMGETVQLLSSFTEEQANAVPFEGSWTAAQVCQHLYLSGKDIDKVLLAPTEVTERQPDERAAELKRIFLDYSTKMKSPDFIVPEEKHYDKKEMIQALEAVSHEIVGAVGQSNLNELAPLPEGHPLAGSTKLEIVHFVTYHSMRHNHQIKNIASALHVKA